MSHTKKTVAAFVLFSFCYHPSVHAGLLDYAGKAISNLSDTISGKPPVSKELTDEEKWTLNQIEIVVNKINSESAGYSKNGPYRIDGATPGPGLQITYQNTIVKATKKNFTYDKVFMAHRELDEFIVSTLCPIFKPLLDHSVTFKLQYFYDDGGELIFEKIVNREICAQR